MQRETYETGDVDVLKALTDTTSLDAVIPEIWSREIEEAAEANLVMRPLAVVDDTLLDAPGDTVHISKGEVVVASDLTETNAIVPQEMSPSEAVKYEPTEKGAGVEISRKAIRRSYRKEMERATTILGKALAKKEDLDIINAVIAGAGTIIYSNGTDDDDITADDILTPDLIKDAQEELEAADAPGPYAIVLHPRCKRSLMQSGDFTDASKYGSDEVVRTGEIGTYLGMKVYKTTNLPKVTNAGLVDVYPTLVLGARAVGIALKANPDFQDKYEPLDRIYTIASVAEWESKILNDYQAVMIRSAGGKGTS